MEVTTNFYVSKVTDPNHIWSFLVKSLRKKILTATSILFTCRCLGRLNGAHFGQFHLFHQPVHPTFADGNAMLPRKTEGHLFDAQPFVGFSVKFQNPLPNLLSLLLPAGGLTPQVLVVGAAVDPEYPAEDGDGMLAGQRINGLQSLSECGVKIAIETP